MARFFIVILFASVVLLGTETTFAQIFGPDAAEKRGEKIFKPLKSIRDRAANGVLKDAKIKICANCKLIGKLCPKCAAKRAERACEEKKEKEKKEAAEAAELKKLEAEAKKAELEAKLLEEQDKERNKPWDLADKENLDSSSPLLKMAAASKIHQDLGPKKQAALDYISKLGCNKDPKVEEAILAGLKDFNPRVRLAAVQAVLDAVRGPSPQVVSIPSMDPYIINPPPALAPVVLPPAPEPAPAEVPCGCAACEPERCPVEKVEEPDPCKYVPPCKKKRCKLCGGKKHLKNIRKGRCRNCRGNGCDACNYCGEVTEVYTDPCSMCFPQMGEEVPCLPCMGVDGCKSCCPSEAIMEELKRIAFDPDKQRKDCYYEPSIDVRNLALEALNICPPLPEKKDDDKKRGVPETGEETKKKGLSESESDSQNSSGDLNVDEDENGKKSVIEDEDVIPLKKKGDVEPLEDDGTQYGAPTPFQSVSYSNQEGQFLSAKLSKFFHDDAYLVQFDGDYLIPRGRRLFVQNSGGASQVVEVLGSEVGFVKVTPIEGRLFDQTDARLSVGIIQ